MKNIIRQEYPWFLAHAVWFWIVPLAANLVSASDQTGFLLLLLMIGNPLFCIICSLFYGMRCGRKWSFLIYPLIAIAASIMMYYNTSAIGFGLAAMVCSVIGLIFGGWSRARKMSEAEKWELKQAKQLIKEKSVPPSQSEQTVHVASKTAMKNQQKAYARKAKERAEKEAKRQNKNQPQQKKKKGGH